MAIARYALTLKDGTIANIVAVDVDDERGRGYQKILEANGHTLVPLKDTADEMAGVNVEPGDKCTDPVRGSFQKGVLGSRPVDLSVVPASADIPEEKV